MGALITYHNKTLAQFNFHIIMIYTEYDAINGYKFYDTSLIATVNAMLVSLLHDHSCSLGIVDGCLCASSPQHCLLRSRIRPSLDENNTPAGSC
jgi:hypothetical protein